MTYATVANVKSLFRNFAGGSNPAVTDVEIQLFLDNAESTINAKIGILYTLPITEGSNPESFNVLKRLEMYAVASEVDDILNSYGEADKKPGWFKRFEKLMKELVPDTDKKTGRQPPPVMKLPDAPYLGTSTQSNRVNINKQSGRVFEKGADNW